MYSTGGDLNEALGNLGSALGGVLGNRRRKQQKTLQRQKIAGELQKGPIDNTFLAKVLASDDGEELLKTLAPIIAPMFKEQARSEGMMNYRTQGNPGYQKFLSDRGIDTQQRGPSAQPQRMGGSLGPTNQVEEASVVNVEGPIGSSYG